MGTNMVKRTEWINREFKFDLPVWMFPNILERLRGTPARLEDRVAGVPPEVLIRRDGKHWSIQEHVGHLGDLEPLHFARMLEYIEGKTELSAADMKNRKTEDANHNSENIDNLLDVFRTSRMRLVALLDTFDESMALRTALHPRLKTPMRILDSNYFWAEHDDHHLAAMSELIHKFK